MKKIKKGFTLVELLVVIAILAILASVSVIGYLSFTEKAKISNVETEMAQIREVVRGTLLDGSKLTVESGEGNSYTLFIDNNGVKATEADPDTASEDWDSAFPDLAAFDDTANKKDIIISTDNITYKDSNSGVQAVWTFEKDTIEGSSL